MSMNITFCEAAFGVTCFDGWSSHCVDLACIL